MNPTLVAILNFIFIGLGSLLQGKRRLLGLMTFLGGSMLRFEEIRIAPLTTGVLTLHWVVMTTGLAFLGIGMAVLGYNDAKADARK